MKSSYSYTGKIKLAVVREWNRTHSIADARAAVDNIPSIPTCYRWIAEATRTEPAANGVRYNKTFKRKAVKMFYRKNRNASAVARQVGTTNVSILRWVKQATDTRLS